ncbi:MAG: helix-hairpin-helix domain-containing protein [Deltaproteobacteria bacterium]|nr:helix-hairpin-helix domain-containing protein [Deltaproteobacteria bacterium]
MTKLTTLVHKAGLAIAIAALLVTGATTWMSATPALAAPAATAAAPAPAGGAASADDDRPAPRRGGKSVSGKLNLNTATEEQLILLPGVGPSKAERVVAYRAKHGPFKRVADLRRVKGFGYRSLKKLEPFLDVKGDTTLRGE